MRVCPYCHIYLTEAEPSCPRDGERAIEVEPEAIAPSLRERFKLVKSFARGGTGSSCLADDLLTGKHGLLKVLRFDSGANAAERMRIKRELAKQTSLSDRAVARIIASGETPEQDSTGKSLWLFREWVEGESLKLVLKREGALEPPRALAVAARIASGLEVLHRAGLQHRDLKPGHIILYPHPSGIPRVTIIDAGIADRIESNALFDLIGTPSYVSPEQAAGKIVSFRSDLYSLGCVLYEMLVGTPPFTGDDVNALLEAHRNTPAPIPEMELPTAVRKLIAELLDKDPRKRPLSAQQVRRTLDPLLPQAEASGEASPISGVAGARPASIPPLRTAPGISSPVKVAPPKRDRRQSVIPPPPPGRPSSSPPEVSPAPLPETLKREPVAEPEVQELETDEIDVLMVIPSPTEALADSSAASGTTPRAADEQTPTAVTRSEPPSELKQQLQESEKVLEPEKPAGIDDTSPSTPLMSAEYPETALQEAAQAGPESPVERFAAMPLQPGQDQAAIQHQQSEPEPVDPDGDENTTTPFVAAAIDDGSRYAEEPAGQRLDPEEAGPTASVAGQPLAARYLDNDGQKAVADPFGTNAKAIPFVGDRRVLVAVVGGLIVAAMLFFFIGRDRSSEVALQGVTSETDPLTADSPPAKPAESEPVAAKQPAPAKAPEAEEKPEIRPKTEKGEPAAAKREAAEQAQQAPERVAAEKEQRKKPKKEPTEAPEQQRARTRSAPEAPTTREKPREPPPVVAKRTTAPATAPAVPAKGGALDRKGKSDELRAKGRKHYAARRHREAATAYREATRYTPSHAGSYAGLGASLLALGDANGAIAAYQRAIQLQPKSSGFHAALGRAYLKKGDRGRAVAAYRKALQLNPNNKIARMALVRLGQK